MSMILAGDVGGTKTVLGLFEHEGDRLRVVRDAVFPSQSYATFDAILAEFLGQGDQSPPQAACFGVAGAVIGGRSHTTNLPWNLEESALAQVTRAARVKLLNDLEAMAYGMIHLEPHELVRLSSDTAVRRRGHAGVIAAGTGLGEALLYSDGTTY